MVTPPTGLQACPPATGKIFNCRYKNSFMERPLLIGAFFIGYIFNYYLCTKYWAFITYTTNSLLAIRQNALKYFLLVINIISPRNKLKSIQGIAFWHPLCIIAGIHFSKI